MVSRFKAWYFKKELKELKDIKSTNKFLTSEVTRLTKRVDDKNGLIRRFKKDANGFRDEISHLGRRIESYVETLSERIKIPTIKYHLKDEPFTEIKPFGNDRTLFDGYTSRFADATYYAYALPVWQKILTRIHPEVVKALGRWRVEISDCDDWALVMNSFVTIAFADARNKRQGAFMTLWSGTHAYNGFIDVNKNIWIYEPQNGKIIGKLENGSGEYKTKLVWFPGDKPL